MSGSVNDQSFHFGYALGKGCYLLAIRYERVSTKDKKNREGLTVNLSRLIESGHFPKVYDPSRRIPEDIFDELLKFMYSIPTSVNAQSTHYLVASTPEPRSQT